MMISSLNLKSNHQILNVEDKNFFKRNITQQKQVDINDRTFRYCRAIVADTLALSENIHGKIEKIRNSSNENEINGLKEQVKDLAVDLEDNLDFLLGPDCIDALLPDEVEQVRAIQRRLRRALEDLNRNDEADEIWEDVLNILIFVGGALSLFYGGSQAPAPVPSY
jgi:hypothetical protein